MIGALIVGESRAAAVHLMPQVELFVIYAVMALVLVFRPQGLFSRVRRERFDDGVALDRSRDARLRDRRSGGPGAAGRGLFRSPPSRSPTRWWCSGLIVLWRAGLVPFGQALFYAIGAYAVALITRYTGMRDVLVLIAAAAALSCLAAFLAGFLLARYREIFFSMLSLAMSMICTGSW